MSEKLPGVVTGAKHSFDQFPAPQDYPRLMEGFAREGARPQAPGQFAGRRLPV